MSSNIETVETAIVGLMSTISYLQEANGGTVRGVSDIKTFMELSTVATPAGIVMFEGEQASPNLTIGRTTHETELHWAIYHVASSFSSSSEGRTGVTGALQMIDDAIGALLGQIISLPGENVKLFYKGAERFGVSGTQVVYTSHWRHAYIRSSTP